MRRHGHNVVRPSLSWEGASLLLLLMLLWPAQTLHAQAVDQQALAQKVQQLTDAMARTQAQLVESQRQLEEMRRQLDALRLQMQQGTPAATTTTPAPLVNASSSSSSAIDEVRERQAMQEAQIATHEQTKVESESKYPVKVTGLLLLNGFANSGAVDMPATPTTTLPGGGSTGASVRQTILGFDARGPHLFGAQSSADLRVDFDGTPASTTASSTYSNSNATLLRLRTAHARLQWNHTEAYFSLDRPIINPDSPSSLTAVAEPALAWSGNLFSWNPQLGVTQDIDLPGSHALRLQAALMDPGDAPASAAIVSSSNATPTQPSAAESSRYPGLEARIALVGSRTDDDSNHIGVGGYFSPHLTSIGRSFDAWAGTLDARLHLPLKLELTGSAYRGLGLGGLGGDGYKDFAYSEKSDGSGYYFHVLNDVGGWAELKRRFGQRFEANVALGIDNVFANDLRRYTYTGAPLYLNLARNRTFTGNVIYSPTAYLLFSVEYRRLNSWQLSGPSAGANITGVAVGYKF
jgi:hypothetical protein